ncbi:MAG: outer membrane protein (porin) [Rickettsiales bacterium]|jgi:hypothetical protein|nr:outer membrane protein (porin) [Rickettsiales bacterium]
MKKLLATTALASVAMIAAPAFAGPTVTVGGTSNFQAGVTDQGAPQGATTNRETKFRNKNEVRVNAEGKADSGLIYGATIELEADVTANDEAGGLNADRTFIYVQGDFGRVEMGSNTDAASALKVDASTLARATGGIDGDFAHFITLPAVAIIRSDLPTAHGIGTGRDVVENASKITYYSPRFSGVQLGLSYTPDQGDRGTATGFSGDAGSDQENVFNTGVNYTGQFNELGLAASATYERGDNEGGVAGGEDLEAFALGANLSYRGLSVGGSWGDWQDSPIATTNAGNDGSYWTAGVAYEQGPAGVSVTYLDSEFASTDFNNISVGADYQLAPGFVPYVEVSFFDLDAAGAGSDTNGNVVIAGTQLTF